MSSEGDYTPKNILLTGGAGMSTTVSSELLRKLDDSKKLSARHRDALFDEIKGCPGAYVGVGVSGENFLYINPPNKLKLLEGFNK